MRISDWSSDVCSSDLRIGQDQADLLVRVDDIDGAHGHRRVRIRMDHAIEGGDLLVAVGNHRIVELLPLGRFDILFPAAVRVDRIDRQADRLDAALVPRSEEHTSELQSLMSSSYAVFCLKKK